MGSLLVKTYEGFAQKQVFARTEDQTRDPGTGLVLYSISYHFTPKLIIGRAKEETRVFGSS